MKTLKKQSKWDRQKKPNWQTQSVVLPPRVISSENRVKTDRSVRETGCRLQYLTDPNQWTHDAGFWVMLGSRIAIWKASEDVLSAVDQREILGRGKYSRHQNRQKCLQHLRHGVLDDIATSVFLFHFGVLSISSLSVCPSFFIYLSLAFSDSYSLFVSNRWPLTFRVSAEEWTD